MRIASLLSALFGLLMAAAFGWPAPARAADDTSFAVIAHPGVARIDASTLQRLYTGRAIEANGEPVTVINLTPGTPPRERFLAQVVGLDNDRYVAYWTVRRHVGKGVPPREFKHPAEVIEFVQSTPGAVGYIPVSDLRPGLNVIYRP